MFALVRYGLGARGIDWMERVKNNVTTTGFPLYDGHGNMVATLARSGSNSWSLNDKRYFDAWGDVEQGAGTGQPSQRYCANLGHVQDDESDLIYMRARYYEPGVGRFLSQDVEKHGSNWFVYCGNNPISRVDYSGNAWTAISSLAFAIALDLALVCLAFLALKEYAAAEATLKAASAAAAVSLGLLDGPDPDFKKAVALLRFFTTDKVISGVFKVILGGLDEAKHKHAVGVTVVVINAAYALLVLGALGATFVEGDFDRN